MKKYLILVLSLLFYSLFAQEKQNTLNVEPGGLLQVSISGGDVKISTWDKPELLVKYNEDTKIRIEKSGSVIKVNSSNFAPDGIEITVPNRFNVEVSNMGGVIEIKDDITGSVTCNSSGGEIYTKNITGKATITSGGGDISTLNISDDAIIKTSGGNVELGDVKGNLRLSTSGGNIDVKDISGQSSISTGGGNIDIKSTSKISDISTGGGNVSITNVFDKIKIYTGGGDISINDCGGEAIISTGAGDLNISNIKKGIKAKTYAGDLRLSFDKDYKGSTELMTSMGDVTLDIPPTADALVKAKIKSFGFGGVDDNIHSDFETKSSIKKLEGFYEADYEINKASSLIEVKLTGGEIFINKTK